MNKLEKVVAGYDVLVEDLTIKNSVLIAETALLRSQLAEAVARSATNAEWAGRWKHKFYSLRKSSAKAADVPRQGELPLPTMSYKDRLKYARSEALRTHKTVSV